MTDTKKNSQKGNTSSNVKIDGGQVGIIGNKAKVEGGLHYHFYYSKASQQQTQPSVSLPIDFDTRATHLELTTPLPPLPTGGAIGVDSHMYMPRSGDSDVLEEIATPRGLVTVKGARQTGKTSMMMRAFASIRQLDNSIRPIIIDFQAFPNETFDSSESIWKGIVDSMVSQLKCEQYWSISMWNDKRKTDWNLDDFFDNGVFCQDDAPILICLDCVDRVMGRSGQGDFFSLVRYLYNRGAIDPTWKKVRWLLSTSSEPSFFIDNLDQSPFNVGRTAEVSSFSPVETLKLAELYGISMEGGLLQQIMEYVGGRPFLVNILFYHMKKCPDKLEGMFDGRTCGNGIFSEYLNRYLVRFQEEPGLAEAMKLVIKGRGCRDIRIAERLQSSGLVVQGADQECVCACRLYSEFFSDKL